MMDKVLINSLGERIDYSFSKGAQPLRKRNWIVLLGHGVTGNKDRPIVLDTANALNAGGFDTLRFSFTGNGNSEGAFRESTLTKETGDLTSVLDAVAREYAKICYIGHSMGGAVGVLVAAEDQRISALVTIAGMVDTKAFAEEEFGEEEPDTGFMWEDEDCPLSSAFMSDLCETIGTVAPEAARVQSPWLLLHGSADDVVNPRDTARIREIKKDTVDVVIVDGADHSFNDPAHKAIATRAVVTWLSEQAGR